MSFVQFTKAQGSKANVQLTYYCPVFGWLVPVKVKHSNFRALHDSFQWMSLEGNLEMHTVRRQGSSTWAWHALTKTCSPFSSYTCVPLNQYLTAFPVNRRLIRVCEQSSKSDSNWMSWSPLSSTILVRKDPSMVNAMQISSLRMTDPPY